MRKRILVLVVMTAAMVVLAAAPAAQAGDTVCANATLTGSYDNVVVQAGATCVLNGAQVKGNVKCDGCRFVDSLHFTRIGGNLEIKKASEGSIFEDTTIAGDLAFVESQDVLEVERVSVKNLKFEKNSAEIEISDSNISGNLQVQENSLGENDEIEVFASRIGGDLQVQKNSDGSFSREIEIENSTVLGNLQMQENSVDELTIMGNSVRQNLQFFKNTGPLGGISNNGIGQNLQCKENSPAPTGAGNTAAKKEDQCRLL